MTSEQKEQIWNALHLGKMEATSRYQLSSHIEGARDHYESICDEVNKAMNVLSDIESEEGQSDG